MSSKTLTRSGVVLWTLACLALSGLALAQTTSGGPAARGKVGQFDPPTDTTSSAPPPQP